jgi:hypothetical protein
VARAPAQPPPPATQPQPGSLGRKAAGTALVVSPEVPAAVGAAGTVAAARAAVGSVLAALVTFLTAKRRRDEAYLTATLTKRAAGRVGDVHALIREELRRDEEFARRAAERMAVNLPRVLAIPDPEQRRAAMRGLLNQEQRFAQQRSEAMAARAIAAVERVVLRQDSPQGAFWRLGPCKEHTAGCLFMQGKFWPWAVLDRVHPPRHPGCCCSLFSYAEALKSGWLQSAAVPDVRDAIRAARGIVMEDATAGALLAELDVRDELVERGFATTAQLAAVPLLG